MKRSIKIISTGIYLPKNKVSASEMDQKLNLQSGWVAEKTGVLNRHYADDSEKAPYMAAQALKEALNKANLKFSDLDLLLSGSGTMAQPIPCNAALIQEAMGELHCGIPSFDMNSTCLSFVTALDHISYAMQAGRYQRIAIVSSEIASIGLNFAEKESAALMGDGAVAIIIERDTSDQSQILSSGMNTYSSGAHYAEIRSGGTNLHPMRSDGVREEDLMFKMDGPKIFKQALKYLPEFFTGLLNQASIQREHLQLFIPHQASSMALKLIQNKLEITDQQYFMYLDRVGNTIGASIPMGIHFAIAENKIQRGDLVSLIGTSAGFSIGGMILRY